MTEEIKEYGLLIERVNRYNTERVIARLVSRENGSPIGCRSPDYDNPWHFDGLAIDYFIYVSEYNKEPAHALGGTPRYENVYSIELNDARKMASTLGKVAKQLERDEAREPGDIFVSLARALKLSFAVEMRGESVSSTYADNKWRFMTIAEGRNRFRQLIETACKEVDAKENRAA